MDFRGMYQINDDITMLIFQVKSSTNDDLCMLICLLQSVPIKVLEDYNMTSMTLEFRRECTQSNMLESMTCPTERVIGESDNNSVNRKPDLQYTHLLRLQDDKRDVVRARSEWNLKQTQQ
jgi:fatty acyl-ACP thioesterase B